MSEQFDPFPLDSSERFDNGSDPQLRPFIRGRIDGVVELAGHSGAEAQRLTAMVYASIEEFLPTRVQWGSAYWARVYDHTDRYLQAHDSPQDARRRLDEIARTEALHRSKDGAGVLVRTALLRRYRGDWVGVAEPNPLENVTGTELSAAADELLRNEQSGAA
ncbi:hypothetical protein [Mycobacteroides abscessus]|uniref:hypothetical protein n=1 Tax=Mycobacteroides abscessus TaxID=36809 RepID=UPI000C25CAB3|nr:hypothetical protein [Mycobacteroides abscessus]